MASSDTEMLASYIKAVVTYTWEAYLNLDDRRYLYIHTLFYYNLLYVVYFLVLGKESTCF